MYNHLLDSSGFVIIADQLIKALRSIGAVHLLLAVAAVSEQLAQVIGAVE